MQFFATFSVFRGPSNKSEIARERREMTLKENGDIK